MTCDETHMLLHALIDGELDAGHARRLEAHTARCRHCTEQLRGYGVMHAAMSAPSVRYRAPATLQGRIEAVLPTATVPEPRARATRRLMLPAAAAAVTSRRPLLRGFAFGSALSAAAAVLLMFAIARPDRDQLVVSDVVSAHLRSLEANHLTDVRSNDQQGIKPWLGDRLGTAPPVPDLAGQGFSLVGGRIDYVLGRAVAAIVYRRSDSRLINLFVAQSAEAEHSARVATMQGVNVELWSEKGLNLCAVGDVSAAELDEFRKKFESAAWAGQI